MDLVYSDCFLRLQKYFWTKHCYILKFLQNSNGNQSFCSVEVLTVSRLQMPLQLACWKLLSLFIGLIFIGLGSGSKMLNAKQKTLLYIRASSKLKWKLMFLWWWCADSQPLDKCHNVEKSWPFNRASCSQRLVRSSFLITLEASIIMSFQDKY